MKKLLLFMGCFCTWLMGSAQMTVDNALTVEEYVQQVLLGDNVTVSNITFNGGSAASVSTAVGGFDCVDCNMSIPSGFLMSSGDAIGAVGPNDETSHSGTGTGGWSGTDPDLVALVQANGGNSVNDWVIIEFDFVPLGDTLRFQYIWASEEYDFYANSGFNDVFGFLVSGPGITGPFSNNAQNIAIVPGTTDLGVGINSINNGSGNAGPCTNCDYYNQDSDADNNFPWPIDPDAEWYTDAHYMQYDGYTDVLTAIAIVQCGLTYHIKLAVCDANDSGYDSAVFLQRDSFSSNLVVQASLELDVAGPDGQTLFENCGDGNLVFTRPISGDPNTELVAYLSYTGQAINGVDYTLLPDSVVFAPGQMTVSLFLDGFTDNLTEGTESVHIQIENLADCGENLLTSSFDFVVADIADPLAVEGYDESICPNSTTTLEPVVTGGYAAYHYDWSTGESTETIDVSPLATTTYFLTVSDTCQMPDANTQFIVTVLDVPELSVSIEDLDNLLPMNCSSWGNLYAIGDGGISPYTYTWTDDTGMNLWGWDNTVSLSAWNAGMVYVEMHDQCGYTAEDSVEIVLNVPPLTLDAPTTYDAACGAQFSITAVASGGDVMGWQYNYMWAVDGIVDWNMWTDTYTGVANTPVTLTVTASDQCGQSISQDIAITLDGPPIVVTMEDDLEGNCLYQFNMVPELSGGSGNMGAWTYMWMANGNILGNGPVLSSTFNQSTLVEFQVTDQCGTTGTDEVNISVVNPPLTVSAGEDVTTSCVSTTNLTANFEGGSGGLSFHWLVNDQQQGTQQNFAIQTLNTANVDILITDVCGVTASDEVIITIPIIPIVVTTSADTSICPGYPAQIWAMAEGGEGGFTYSWNFGSAVNELTVNPDFTTNYVMTAYDICGRSQSGDVTVNVLPVAAEFNVTSLGNNQYIFEGTPNPVCVDCFMMWNFGDGNTSQEQVTDYEFDGLEPYTVSYTVTNEIGCTDTRTYEVIPPPYFYIPTAFTPNGDGVNDVFQVFASSVMEYEFVIFNRWGDVVFSSKDPKDVWTGSSKGGDYYIPNGMYSYSIRVKGFDSETYKEKGSIMMMR